MAELRIPDVDERVLARLRERAEQQNRSVETLIREELERAVSLLSPAQTAEEESFVRTVERLRATPAEERVPDVEPVEIEGIPASELLIRDRRRR